MPFIRHTILNVKSRVVQNSTHTHTRVTRSPYKKGINKWISKYHYAIQRTFEARNPQCFLERHRIRKKTRKSFFLCVVFFSRIFCFCCIFTFFECKLVSLCNVDSFLFLFNTVVNGDCRSHLPLVSYWYSSFRSRHICWLWILRLFRNLIVFLIKIAL